MTQAAAKTIRAVPPPLPSTYTSAESGVRPLSELLPPGTFAPLRRVSLRVDAELTSGQSVLAPAAAVDAELVIEFVQDSHFVTGLSRDLSRGGIFVATYQRLPVGTKINLSIELPNGHVVEARGAVRWIEEPNDAVERPGMGVVFTDICPGAVAAIAEYCRLRPPLYFDL